MHAAFYYLLATGLLSVYGGEVCPFLEGLGIGPLALNVGAAFLLAWFARVRLLRWADRAPPLARSSRQLSVDLGMFAAVGVALGVYNTLVYGFPLHSGLKIVLGCLTIGLFAALDLGLVRERTTPDVDELPAFGWALSLPGKLTLITVVGLLMSGGVIALMIAMDFAWLAQNPGADMDAARDAALVEVAFGGLVVMGFAFRVVFVLAGNLKLFFDREVAVLEAVSAGDLAVRVPVASRDEFGLIAHHTNTMIAGLEERERVKNLFGKVVSPDVAQRLLDDDGDLLGGTRQSLVILMSDVRGFTARAEGQPPERVVATLNAYFSRMVEIVHTHGGVVDKFIGDGLLAVFGLSGREGAAKDAVTAAQAMLAALPEVNAGRDDPLAIGVGVHQGEVIAGAVGAPDRLEFTVIGDAVNIAARLESLTKALPTSLAISGRVLAALPEDERAGWRDLGEHALKGRLAPVRVYGRDTP